MRLKPTRIAILLLFSAVAAQAQLSLAMLKPFQSSPVAVGARLNAGWLLPNAKPAFSLTGEALFPVFSGVRVRASVIDAVVGWDGATLGLDTVYVNTNLSLDAMASTRLGRTRFWPYAWLGPELGGKLSNLRIGLRAGLGMEGQIAKGTAAFAELGAGYGQPVSGQGSATLRVRLGAGVRLGKFAR